jgi:hypothetical protein
MTYDGSTAPLSTPPVSTRKSIGTRASIYADDPGEALVCGLPIVVHHVRVFAKAPIPWWSELRS